MRQARHVLCIGKTPQAAALLLLTIALAIVPGGCTEYSASDLRPTSETPRLASQDESAFASGEHRAATAKTLFSMARILETQGKDSEAEYVLRSIIASHPAFMPAYCELSETLLRQRRIDEAVHILQAGLAHAAAPDPILQNDLGMCQLLRDDPAGALPFFTHAAAIAPDDARYRSNMAVALGMTGRYAEALAIYRMVLPDRDAHYNLGVLCQTRHDQARADEEFQLAQPSRPIAPIAAVEPATQPSNDAKSQNVKTPEQGNATDQPPPDRAGEEAAGARRPVSAAMPSLPNVIVRLLKMGQERCLSQLRSEVRRVLGQMAILNYASAAG